MQSMTGYGSASLAMGELQVSIEIQSVNRRGLELGISLPREWQAWEPTLVSKVKSLCFRGKINATVKVACAEGENGLQWDESALEATLLRLKGLSERLEIPWPPDTDTLVRLISLHRSEGSLAATDEIQRSLEQTFDKALSSFVEMRACEGGSLRNDFIQRVDRLEALLKQIIEQADGSVDRYRGLLMERLQQAGLDLDLQDERVLKEVAIFADRCDITEETTRLASHFAQFRDVLKGADGGDAVGRKLEFILQEINREFNTIGSKSNRIEISQAVIEAKNEIERVREQVQNVE